jgi:glycyl-tRNA synthetase
MHPEIWKASGHVESFADVVSECKRCHKRFRIEELFDEEYLKYLHTKGIGGVKEEDILSSHKAIILFDYALATEKPECPVCKAKDFSQPATFNLMFKTYQGPVEDAANLIYLRPETAQGIFVNFLNILDSRHRKVPFGVAQIGKAFRNEITPGNFTFRTREFEQMEIEYFVRPEEAGKYYEQWIEERFNWYVRLGIKKENLRLREHTKDELAHYALACTDIEYNFPFGWSELEGIANRGDFDLRQHAKFSGKDLSFFDDVKREKFIPYIIEPSGGVDRALLAFLVDSYREEEVRGKTRVVLGLSKELAPVKVAVFPLLKNRAEIVEIAKKIAQSLSKKFVTRYDDTASIGKLYRRQDEVGTLYCITVDVQSIDDKKVTVRERDSMNQDRV